MNTQSNQETQYDGHCAFAVSLGKKDVLGKQKCFLIQEGNKYLFSNSVAKLLWRVIPGQKNKADSVWSSEQKS